MKIHTIPGYIQTIYLAVYEHKILLLDGCCKPDVKLIQDYIVNTLHRPIEQLKAVVVTHEHPDHCGGANRFRKYFGCKIVSGINKGNWYGSVSGFAMYLTDLMLAKWMAKRLGKGNKSVAFWPQITPCIRLKDGEAIPEFEDWTVIYTPGHTDRDISLFHKSTKTVYVADLAVKVKNKFIPPFPIFYPEKYKQSLRKIEKLAPKQVALAHGGFVNISHSEYFHLMTKAPTRAITHWFVVKTKLKQYLAGR